MKTYFLDVVRVISRNRYQTGQSRIDAKNEVALRWIIKNIPCVLAIEFEGDEIIKDPNMNFTKLGKGYHPVHILKINKTGEVIGHKDF